MLEIFRSEPAEQDIIEVITYTKSHWGEEQARRYRRLIEDAHVMIATHPKIGRPYRHKRSGVRAYPVRQPGRPGRHLLFYHIVEKHTVEVLRFIHDARDADLLL